MKGKKVFWRIFWGLGFVLAAALLLVDSLGLIAPIESFAGDISIFAVIAAFLLIAFTVYQLIKGRIAWLFMPLAIIFLIFEKNIATLIGRGDKDLINNFIVLIIAGLLSIGFLILFSSRKRKEKKRAAIGFEHQGKGAENNFASSVIYVDCTDFTPSHIENNMGACSVQFVNVERYAGGKTICVKNNLGSICISVPQGWIVKSNIDTHLGGTGIQTDETGYGPLLFINGENNLGSISIKYV